MAAVITAAVAPEAALAAVLAAAEAVPAVAVAAVVFNRGRKAPHRRGFCANSKTEVVMK